MRGRGEEAESEKKKTKKKKKEKTSHFFIASKERVQPLSFASFLSLRL